MHTRVKTFLSISIIIVLVSAAFLLGRAYLLNRAKEKMETKLAALSELGLQIRYDSIYLDWRRNLLVIEKFILHHDAYDTACVYPEFVSADQIRIKGFRLINFLLTQTFSFESVIINDPHIVTRKHSSLLPDTVARPMHEFLMKVDDVRLVSAHIEYTDSAACNLLADITADLQVSELAIDQPLNKSISFTPGALTVFNASIRLPEVMYALNIKAVSFDPKAKTVALDTMRIIPQLPKLAFGRKAGREIDRVEGIIPFIRFKGCEITYSDTVNFRATTADIQGFMKFFRDKRLVHRQIYKPLPVAHLRRLPFGLHIDTLRIEKSYVEYEEFPEGSDATGSVFFDDLRGEIIDINNNGALTNGQTIVNAGARFMGAGDLQVHTVFPWGPKEQCLTEGVLRNMSLPEVNKMFEPMANMKFESGNLESLKFRFTYDAIRSEGKVELNYRDLKIVSFRDEAKDGKDKKKNRNKDGENLKRDNLKTFIINTFVIRKNMTERLPDEKRSGEIMFNRDTSRSIFNYWWKSVFSGIKSAYNIETPETPDKP